MDTDNKRKLVMVVEFDRDLTDLHAYTEALETVPHLLAYNGRSVIVSASACRLTDARILVDVDDGTTVLLGAQEPEPDDDETLVAMFQNSRVYELDFTF